MDGNLVKSAYIYWFEPQAGDRFSRFVSISYNLLTCFTPGVWALEVIIYVEMGAWENG